LKGFEIFLEISAICKGFGYVTLTDASHAYHAEELRRLHGSDAVPLSVFTIGGTIKCSQRVTQLDEEELMQALAGG